MNMHAVQGSDSTLLGLPVSPVSVTVRYISLPIELSDYWCHDFSVIHISGTPTERPAQHNHMLPYNSSRIKIGGSQSV
jgi:hypothetical protein